MLHMFSKHLSLVRTTPENPDFQDLIALLDSALAINNGNQNYFFASHNKTDTIRNAIVAYLDEIPAATGAIKPYSETKIEIKRMFVHPDFRRNGIASSVLDELENWARELGFREAILETGTKQTEALGLYPKKGYQITPNYPPYENSGMSVCMRKNLIS